MREIGAIKQVQIQCSSLKQGQRPHRYYDPSPLLLVERLRLEPGGALGFGNDREPLIDVHHAEHPNTKNRQHINGLSIGFTSHYRAMRERFGPHLTDGCAGENILIDTDLIWPIDALGNELAIECRDGRTVVLDGLIVAAPCVEFSRFASFSAEPLANDELRTTLQFLDGGTRGFYLRLAPGQLDAEIGPGDRVFVR